MNAYTKFSKIQSICAQDIEGNEIKTRNSVSNLLKMTGNNHNLDVVKINIYIYNLVKLCQLILMILSGNEILT